MSDTVSEVAPVAPTKVRTKHPVSPEVAALVREADESFAATLKTAQAIVATANAMVEQAKERAATTARAVLCHLGVEGNIVATEGRGDSTVLVIETEEATNG